MSACENSRQCKVGKNKYYASLIYLFENDDGCIAVDADPDASLGLTLGIRSEELLLDSFSEMKEVIEQKSGGGGVFYSLNPEVEDVIDDYSINRGKTNLANGWYQAGGACYCRENSFLNAILNLCCWIKKGCDPDMGAGIEHLTRGHPGVI